MSVASSCDDMSVQPKGNVRSPGRLVVVTGLPGTGKTRLGKKLATSMPAIRLCPDDWMMASGIDLWTKLSGAGVSMSPDWTCHRASATASRSRRS